jgi:hypothetical protein
MTRAFAFLYAEDGAVTVDWVVGTAAAVAMTIAVMGQVRGGATALADRIADRIAGIEIGVFGVNDQSGGSDAQNGSSEGVN